MTKIIYSAILFFVSVAVSYSQHDTGENQNAILNSILPGKRLTQEDFVINKKPGEAPVSLNEIFRYNIRAGQPVYYTLDDGTTITGTLLEKIVTTVKIKESSSGRIYIFNLEPESIELAPNQTYGAPYYYQY